MYTVDKFCCRLSLKVGTIILAGFNTFTAACYFLYSCIAAGTAEEGVHYEISIPVTLSSLIVNGCLLFGAIKENRYFMLPYIILSGSILVVLLYLGLILSIAEPFVLLIFILIGPVIYCWLVIYSYYESLNPNRAIASPSMVSYNPPMGMDTKYPEVV